MKNFCPGCSGFPNPEPNNYWICNPMGIENPRNICFRIKPVHWLSLKSERARGWNSRKFTIAPDCAGFPPGQSFENPEHLGLSTVVIAKYLWAGLCVSVLWQSVNGYGCRFIANGLPRNSIPWGHLPIPRNDDGVG